jgi:hypothetical protein
MLNLEVTFSIKRETLIPLIKLVEEQLGIIPARIDNPEPPHPDKRIFINYRRNDSEDVCGRIYDRLVQAFGRGTVFRDVGSILPGFDFRLIIEQEVAACHIMLVLMGLQWSSEENKARMQREDDFVRLEIEAALRRDIPVIPVWVGRREAMPDEDDLPPSIQGLRFRNARQVKADPDFHSDMDHLIEDIYSIFELMDELEVDEEA